MGEAKVYLVNVIEDRAVSNLIADILEVTHQSPQLLLIKDGKCIHQSSHLTISASAAAKHI